VAGYLPRQAPTSKTTTTIVQAARTLRSYEVDTLRALMLFAGTSNYGLAADLDVLLGVTAVLTAIAARVYARMGF
jgi:hypothetical protein